MCIYIEVKNIVGCEGIEGRVVLLTKNHKIYSWGCNRAKALGYEASDKNVQIPQQIMFNKKFIKVAIGGQHTAAVTFDFKAYTWGNNSNGQLGTGNKQNSVLPVASGSGAMGKYNNVKDII